MSNRVAEKRHKAHAGHRTERFFSDPCAEDTAGATAEEAFERLTGLPMDRTVRKRGDGGTDFAFVHPVNGRRVTVDVKGTLNRGRLLLKADYVARHKTADIYVLADVAGSEVRWVGWATLQDMTSCPVMDLGRGILNHVHPRESLRPIERLLDFLPGAARGPPMPPPPAATGPPTRSGWPLICSCCQRGRWQGFLIRCPTGDHPPRSEACGEWIALDEKEKPDGP